MANFLRGHEAAFAAWGGLPRVVLYDNLKSVVLERQGDAIRFHPTLLEFAAHYRFEPRPVVVARGNEEGRVERAMRSVHNAEIVQIEGESSRLKAVAMDVAYDLAHVRVLIVGQFILPGPLDLVDLGRVGCDEEPERTVLVELQSLLRSASRLSIGGERRHHADFFCAQPGGASATGLPLLAPPSTVRMRPGKSHGARIIPSRVHSGMALS
jgi:hypothetical protein